jgi:acyl-CoA hydrolase
LFATGAIRADVGLVQVSPPDAGGWVTLGTGVDYAADAVPFTATLIAEINDQMPATQGAPRLHLSRFAATVRTSRPLLDAPDRPSSTAERAIAEHVAGLIDDGSTIQIGVGSLPSAVLDALSGHRDLGLHSGMISDAVVRLVRAGVMTGACKEVDPGRLVTGAALGTEALYRAIPELPVDFCPVSYTHDPAVLAQLQSLVSTPPSRSTSPATSVPSMPTRSWSVPWVDRPTSPAPPPRAVGARSSPSAPRCAGVRRSHRRSSTVP